MVVDSAELLLVGLVHPLLILDATPVDVGKAFKTRAWIDGAESALCSNVLQLLLE